jgi:hypothetical protein
VHSGLGGDLRVEPAAALGTEDPALRQPHDELAAGETLETRAPQKRVQLLLECPVQRGDGGHSERNTPVTTPSTWT